MLTIDGLDIFQSLVSANKYAYIYTTKKKQDNNVPQKREPDEKKMPVKARHAINIKY
jgi:hypothetical protein